MFSARLQNTVECVSMMKRLTILVGFVLGLSNLRIKVKGTVKSAFVNLVESFEMVLINE